MSVKTGGAAAAVDRFQRERQVCVLVSASRDEVLEILDSRYRRPLIGKKDRDASQR